jgi:hypothetical protein
VQALPDMEFKWTLSRDWVAPAECGATALETAFGPQRSYRVPSGVLPGVYTVVLQGRVRLIHVSIPFVHPSSANPSTHSSIRHSITFVHPSINPSLHPSSTRSRRALHARWQQ